MCIRDRVISPEYGAGWYSWSNDITMLFDPGLVGLVEEGDEGKIHTYVSLKWAGEYLEGSERGLEVWWVPLGKKFRIHDYDGAETIEMMDQIDWITA